MRANQKGQGLVEYLMLVALISVVAIGVVATVGKNITEQYSALSDAITEKSHAKPKFTHPNAEVQKGRGMGDWMENARRSEGGTR